MVSVNNSMGKANWSQLKNVDAPLSECNVTSAIDAAQDVGFDVMALRKSTDPDKRPPDDLYEFLHSDKECLALRDKIAPKAEPNELMAVLAFGLGKWIGAQEKVLWKPNYDIALIAKHIIQGGVAIVHGRYAAKETKGIVQIDHITALVGINYQPAADGKSFQSAVSWIMDDPYGDYRTQYTSHVGDDITMPAADAVAYLKPLGSVSLKDAILVSK